MNSEGCINDKYRQRLARRNWYANVQAPYFDHTVELVNAKIKSHYVRYFDLTSLNIHLIENAPALLQSSLVKGELVDELIGQVEATIRNARTEFSSQIARFGKLCDHHGICTPPKFFQEPLRVMVRILSPICIGYLEAIQEADQLVSILENLRLRSTVKRTDCDREIAKIDHLLKAIQRSAFGIAQGLRRRTHREVGPSNQRDLVTSASSTSIEPDNQAILAAVHTNTDDEARKLQTAEC